MEEKNLALAELASRIIGLNMRKQVKRMLYQSGYSARQIDEIMRKDKRQGEQSKSVDARGRQSKPVKTGWRNDLNGL